VHQDHHPSQSGDHTNVQDCVLSRCCSCQVCSSMSPSLSVPPSPREAHTSSHELTRSHKLTRTFFLSVRSETPHGFGTFDTSNANHGSSPSPPLATVTSSATLSPAPIALSAMAAAEERQTNNATQQEGGIPRSGALEYAKHRRKERQRKSRFVVSLLRVACVSLSR